MKNRGMLVFTGIVGLVAGSVVGYLKIKEKFEREEILVRECDLKDIKEEQTAKYDDFDEPFNSETEQATEEVRSEVEEIVEIVENIIEKVEEKEESYKTMMNDLKIDEI